MVPEHLIHQYSTLLPQKIAVSIEKEDRYHDSQQVAEAPTNAAQESGNLAGPWLRPSGDLSP
jgi:hypothetical protein